MAMLVHTSKISTFSQFLCLSGYLKRKFPSELFGKMCSIGFTLSISSLLNVISEKKLASAPSNRLLKKNSMSRADFMEGIYVGSRVKIKMVEFKSQAL